MEGRDNSWIGIQKRTFTRWVNQHLGDRMLKLSDLFEDLEDGLMLINLLEIISDKKIPTYNKRPKIRAQKLENNSFGLNFLKNENIKLVAIGPEDIVDKQGKLILGLIWTIILRYQIQKGDGAGSAKQELLEWVRRQIPECEVNNFTTSWKDGKAICHLVDSLQRGLVDLDAVDANPDPLANAELGETVAENELAIPKVLLPEDMVSEKPDELSVMTYVSYYRDYLDNLAKRRGRAEKERAAVPEKTIAYGPGIQEAEQFIPAEFTIQAKNCFDTECPAHGEKFIVSIASPKKGNCPATVKDHENNDGKYTVNYTPTDPGRHVVSVALQGRPIKSSPFNVPVAKTSVSADGPGLEKGEQYTPSHFTINAPKMFQAGVKPDPSEFDVKVQGPNSSLEPQLKDNDDGTFCASYTPTEPGRHVVAVQLKGKPIANGPFSVPVDKTFCLAKGPGLDKAEQFIPASFTIEAPNFYKSGNYNGPTDFDVKIAASKGSLTPTFKDNEDGTFDVTYTPEEAGRHNISVNLKGSPISNGPWSVPVSTTSCSASGAGLDKGEQFVPSEFVVNAQPLKDAGVEVTPEDLDVKISGPQGLIEPEITPNDDGSFNVKFTPTDVGRHNVDAALKGQPICTASVPVQKTGCTADGDGLKNAEQFQPSEFKIDASPLAASGNPLKEDEIEVDVKGPTGPVDAKITPNEDGTFDVAYTPTEVGPHSVKVGVKGQEIANNKVPVEQTECKLSGPGLDKAEQFLPSNFTVEADKLFKSPFSEGSSDFEVKVTNPKGTEIPTEIKDNGDGTYDVSYVPEDVGKCNVAVACKGTPLKDTPVSVPVEKTTSRAFGPGLENGEQFVPSAFTVDVSPLVSNEIPCSEDDVKVKVAGPSGPIDALVTPQDNGNFQVSYTPKEIGKHNVQVALKGTEIANAAVPVTKTSCSITGLDEPAEQFIPSTFAVDVKPLATSGVECTPEDISPIVMGPKGPIETSVTPSDEEPGVYNVSFTPTDPGPHKVTTAVKGQEIVNKPVNVKKTSCKAAGPGLDKGEQFVPSKFTVDATPMKESGVPLKPEEIDVKVTGPQGPVETEVKDNDDGTFDVSFTPKDVGRHNVVAAVKGEEIAKNSVPVQKTTCSAAGPGLEKGEQFVPTSFVIDASPLEENGVPALPEDIVVKIESPQGPVEPTITPTDDGKFVVGYTPKDIARHTVQVALKGAPIANSSVPVTKTTCSAIGVGLEKGEQFIPCPFTVDAKTLATSGVPLTPEDVDVSVTSPSGKPVETTITPAGPKMEPTGEVDANGDPVLAPVAPSEGEESPEEGTFSVVYVPQEVGKHTVHASVKGQDISNRPVFIQKTTCGAAGPGLEKATQFLPAEFQVLTAPLAQAGVPLTPEDVAVKVTGPQGPIDAQITPNDDGSFTAVYIPEDVGRHAVEVQLKGTPISNKNVPVTKTEITIDGDGIKNAEQYIPSEFAIDARSLQDKGVKPAPEDFEVEIESPTGAKIPVEVIDNEDGTFPCKYTPVDPGRHKLGIKKKGKPVLANHVIPVDKSKTDASQSNAFGKGLEPGNFINVPTDFTIQARNKIGDPMKTGGELFKVSVTGPLDEVVDNQLTDNNDGTYHVDYEPTLPGDHKVEVSLMGNQIADSPFTVPVERSDQDPDPPMFDVYGKGIEGGDTADPCEFTVVAKNSKGDPIPNGGHPVECEVTGPGGKDVPVELTDNQDGTYNVSYKPLDPGPHEVAVILRTKIPLYYDHVKDSPYNVPIDHGTDNDATLVWGPGLEEVYDTKPTEFYIKAKDRDGNDMGKGGEPFSVDIQGPNGPVPVDIKDNDDGTYTASYAPEDHGDHKIEVKLRDKHVAKSPYELFVKEGASHQYTCIEKFQFTIQTKTKADENKPLGGETFEVSVSNTSSGDVVEDVKVTDLSDGCYLCDYSLPAPGDYSVAVKLNGHDIKGSPFAQNYPQ